MCFVFRFHDNSTLIIYFLFYKNLYILLHTNNYTYIYRKFLLLMVCFLMFLKVSDRICNLFEYLHDFDLKNSCRVKSADFTRSSPLNFVNLILMFLAKGGKSNTLELMGFFDVVGELWVSKEAFSQTRLKLKPLVFKKLKEFYLSMVYENKDMIKKMNGYILLACDGSELELPHHKSLIKIFGGTKNKFGEIKSCMYDSNLIYDVLNRFIFDFEVDAYKTGEKTLAYRNLKNLFRLSFLKKYKKIFIFDRGYRAIEFFHYLMKKEEKFIFRLRTIDYKKEKSKLRNNDQNIDIIISLKNE